MDSQLKQRLIGAAVLIALAIIFVPMFLSGVPPKQDTATVNLDIPPPPEREFQTRVVPAGSAHPATVPAPAPVSPPDHVATVDVTDAPPAAEKPASSAPPAAPPKPAEAANVKPAPAPPVAATSAPPPVTPPAAAGRFGVHLGVYSSAANVNALVATAKKLGLPVYTDAAEVDGKSATRVRLGPFANRAAAEAARLKLKQAEPKVPSSVVETAGAEPTADAPATALAPNRAGAWAVQVGAFKVQDEANKLRDRAKNAGFAAFVEPVGQGAERLWRVRVGPETDRGNAEKLRDQLRQKLALNGTIVTQS